MFLQLIRVSQQSNKSFKRLNATCKFILATRKIKTCMPSSQSSYIDQTTRASRASFKKHKRNKGQVKHIFKIAILIITII